MSSSGNHFGELSWHCHIDDPSPYAHELGAVLQTGHIAQQYRGRSRHPWRRSCWNARHGCQDAKRSCCRCDHHGVRYAVAHSEGKDIHHRLMVHDVSRRHIAGHDFVDWQHHQRGGRSSEAALQCGTHTDMNAHGQLPFTIFSRFFKKPLDTGAIAVSRPEASKFLMEPVGFPLR